MTRTRSVDQSVSLSSFVEPAVRARSVEMCHTILQPLLRAQNKCVHGTSVCMVSQQYVDTILWNGPIARGSGWKDGRQASYFSAARRQRNKAVFDHPSWKPKIARHGHHKWHIDTMCRVDLCVYNSTTLSVLLFILLTHFNGR